MKKAPVKGAECILRNGSADCQSRPSRLMSRCCTDGWTGCATAPPPGCPRRSSPRWPPSTRACRSAGKPGPAVAGEPGPAVAGEPGPPPGVTGIAGTSIGAGRRTGAARGRAGGPAVVEVGRTGRAAAGPGIGRPAGGPARTVPDRVVPTGPVADRRAAGPARALPGRVVPTRAVPGRGVPARAVPDRGVDRSAGAVPGRRIGGPTGTAPGAVGSPGGAVAAGTRRGPPAGVGAGSAVCGRRRAGQAELLQTAQGRDWAMFPPDGLAGDSPAESGGLRTPRPPSLA
jgi:hypothetical protein